MRPAWVEVDLGRLRRNFEIINANKPAGLRLASVLKDEAYGHGALAVARVALEQGVSLLALATLPEAIALREAGIGAPILLLGQRTEEELPWCVAHDLACCVGDAETVHALARAAAAQQRCAGVHVKVDTGMSRFGVRWTEALALIDMVRQHRSLSLQGLLSHFAMSDELDKSFARLQLGRFRVVLEQLKHAAIPAPPCHLCNSGGFLDLPEAHFDLVRLGILPLGVYPSDVCRRLEGLAPVMTVKTRLVAVRDLRVGDYVGYGMRYRAESPRRLGVLPLGYADGYPRVRNLGYVLVRGRRAPILGGTAMDAMMVDLTDIPGAARWDEAVLMGRQGEAEITAHTLAGWKGTVSYEVMTAWRARLPRRYLDDPGQPARNPATP